METNWHVLPLPETLKNLKSRESGLTNEEVAARLKESGPNSLPELEIPGIFSIFISQFLSPLIYLLMIAAAIVLYMGEVADGIIIFLVLIINAVIGTIQEGKAQNTLLALKKFVQGSATVLRSGETVIIPDKDVVPGDIVILQEGEKVPADARLISSHSLRTNESALTGESTPTSKISDELSKESLLIQEQRNMVFKGTSVVSGTGRAVIVATGLNTQIGKISQKITSIDADLPLKKNISHLSKAIIVTASVISVIIFLVGISRGESLRQMFATVVSLSVSIVPEGLPIVMTLILASGVLRMSKQQVLIKKLQAVEGLGQAKIIAVDKTGTLTKNQMVLEKLFVGGNLYDVSGAGYYPEGSVILDGKSLDPLNHPDIIMAGRIASFCSNANAVYVEKEKAWKVYGDPTEAALRVFAKKIGFKEPEKESVKIFDLPFDYITKYHVSIHKFRDSNFLSLIGAPEKVLDLCSRVWRNSRSEKLSAQEKKELELEFLRLSRNGYRILAFALNQDSKESVESDNFPQLAFAGFYAMRDPLREEVKEAVNRAKNAGIRVVMITGDHRATAVAIAKEAGIFNSEDAALTGEELEKLSEPELIERFAECNVFARVNPEQKLKIVEIFKKRGEIVAMTGDGVNDAPSLAAADLGVAMGKIGTEVAKEASDMVLLDDNFGNIISAVEEGRNIYKTIRKVILYLFSTSIGEVATIGGALLIGMPLPILPVQIIWLNFITDGFLVVPLAMEPKEKNLLGNNFKKPSKYILDPSSVRRMFFMGFIIAVGTLWIFSEYLEQGMAKAITVSLTVLAVFQWFNAWNCRSENQSVFTMNPFKNMFLVGATFTIVSVQAFAIYNPFMQKILYTTPLNASDWIFIIEVSATIIIFEELRKLIRRFIAKISF